MTYTVITYTVRIKKTLTSLDIRGYRRSTFVVSRKPRSTNAILLVGRQNLILSGIEKILHGDLKKNIRIDQDTDVNDALTRYRELSPDLTIIIDDYNDVYIPNLIQEIKYIRKKAAVLLVSGRLSEVKVRTLVETGVDGIVSKTCTDETFVTAVKTVLDGQSYFCHNSANLLAKNVRHAEALDDRAQEMNLLSRREKEIFFSLLNGTTPEDIASFYHISVKTVSSHKSNIMKKFKLKSDFELFKVGLEIGFYE